MTTPLHRYVEAFNARDFDQMTSVFAPDLHTIHPGEPDVDVVSSAPFLERMRALWPRGIVYELRQVMTDGDCSQEARVWGELLALQADGTPLASELVLYRISAGLVDQITVYKQMHPTHSAYLASTR